MNKMRVCLISREYPPDTGWGGVGAYTYQIAHGLVENGHDVEVIALCAKKEQLQSAAPALASTDARIRVHRVEWENTLDELNLLLVAAPSAHFVLASAIALWRKFLALHREHPFDVVEVPEHLAAGLFQGVTSIVPLVVKLHTPHSKFVSEKFHGVLPTLDHQLICLFERITMLFADRLCSPSRDLAHFVAGDMNLEVDDIAFVRNPVDIDRFSPTGNRALPQSDRAKVLFVGRLEERKGIRFLIDAVPMICAKFPNVDFVVVGADTNTAHSGGSVLAEMKGKLESTGCSGNVSFVPHVPLETVSDYYRSADICVVPSLYENAPYTCIEAMSCGKPVVTTSAGGSAEYVRHNQSGLVVPPASAEALADAILQLLNSSNQREAFGTNARSFVTQELDRRHIAREMEDLYAGAISTHRGNRGMYRKQAELVLADAVDLLCSTEQMIFDVLYKLSFEFRLKHWARFLMQRPGLGVATLALSAFERLRRVTGYAGKQPAFLDKLEAQVRSKQAPRFEMTRALSRALETPSASSRTTTESSLHACK